jgi:hypothetical protein
VRRLRRSGTLLAWQQDLELLTRDNPLLILSYTPSMAHTLSVPSYVELLWPTVKAIRALGGSGSISEIVEKVVELEGFTEEQQAVPHGDGPQSQIEYRLA